MPFDEAFTLLAAQPEVGHKREDLTDRPIKFWSVYSYLIVYDPARAPLSIIAVLHGSQDVERLLKDSKEATRPHGALLASNVNAQLPVDDRWWMHKPVALVDDAHVLDGDPLMLVSAVATMNVTADHDLGPNPLNRY